MVLPRIRVMLPKSSKMILTSTPRLARSMRTARIASQSFPSARMKYSRKMNRSAFSILAMASLKKSAPVGK